jgi:hypothetical protein
MKYHDINEFYTHTYVLVFIDLMLFIDDFKCFF